MKDVKKYKLQDIIENIEKVDKMIQLNSSNPSKLMVDQYEYRKERLLSELIDELKDVRNLSKYSFQLIFLAINKYYPELIKSSTTKGKRFPKKDKHYKELKELEAVLVA
jgi:hypothetical protein